MRGPTPDEARREVGGHTLPLPVTVRLIGEDGNAFSIIARVSSEMRRAGYRDLVDEFRRQAMESDYDNLLGTVMDWVEVE